jgi:hypothetical protein
LKETAERGVTLTAGELYKYISDETEGVPYYARKLHGRIQTPQILGDKDKIILGK